MVYACSRIYSQLAEVQKRREEDRRKAEYRSYRLNAQLYNKVHAFAFPPFSRHFHPQPAHVERTAENPKEIRSAQF